MEERISNNQGTIGVVCFNSASLLSAEQWGLLFLPAPPLDAFTRRSQEIFHITKPSLWPFSFFFQKAMFLSVSLPLPKLSGLRSDFTLLTITM